MREVPFHRFGTGPLFFVSCLESDVYSAVERTARHRIPSGKFISAAGNIAGHHLEAECKVFRQFYLLSERGTAGSPVNGALVIVSGRNGAFQLFNIIERLSGAYKQGDRVRNLELCPLVRAS